MKSIVFNLNINVPNDFKNIQDIYEGYRGQSFDPSPNIGYTATDAGPAYTYRKGSLPGNTPGGGGENTYTPGMNTGVSEVAEEVPVAKLSEWIDTELQKAKMFGMDYCVMVLSDLKRRFRV